MELSNTFLCMTEDGLVEVEGGCGWCTVAGVCGGAGLGITLGGLAGAAIGGQVGAGIGAAVGSGKE